MRVDKLKLLVGMLAVLCSVVRAQVRTPAPPDPGPPDYTHIQRMLDGSVYVFHNDDWAAIAFLRDPGCVPSDFNLLDTADLTPAFPGGPPRPFLCPLTVSGFAVWKNGPPPIDFVPIQVVWHGLGAVPVWFVKLAEIRAAATDDKLTITEILALPSLRKGSARVYDEVSHPGAFRPQGLGNGSIEVTANGILEDGRSFQLEWVEMGKKDGGGVSYLRHGRIEFK